MELQMYMYCVSWFSFWIKGLRKRTWDTWKRSATCLLEEDLECALEWDWLWWRWSWLQCICSENSVSKPRPRQRCAWLLFSFASEFCVCIVRTAFLSIRCLCGGLGLRIFQVLFVTFLTNYLVHNIHCIWKWTQMGIATIWAVYILFSDSIKPEKCAESAGERWHMAESGIERLTTCATRKKIFTWRSCDKCTNSSWFSPIGKKQNSSTMLNLETVPCWKHSGCWRIRGVMAAVWMRCFCHLIIFFIFLGFYGSCVLAVLSFEL